MNAQKYTQKSLEAVQAAQSLAVENSNQQIEQQHLPLPLDRTYEPETLEEQVVCYADKFYSKSHVDRERTVVETAQSLEKFGPEGVQRFLKWVKLFE